MAVAIVEFPAIVSVEIFTADKDEALREASQYLHLAQEEWRGIQLDGIGYEMSVFVDEQADGKVSYVDYSRGDGPTLFAELCEGMYEVGQVFEDVMGNRWTFVQAFPLTKNVTFINQEANEETTIPADELEDTRGLRELDGVFAPPTTLTEKYELHEAAFEEARAAGLPFDECVKAARRLKE